MANGESEKIEVKDTSEAMELVLSGKYSKVHFVYQSKNGIKYTAAFYNCKKYYRLDLTPIKN